MANRKNITKRISFVIQESDNQGTLSDLNKRREKTSNVLELWFLILLLRDNII